ncbi:MAG: hypothetical protein ABIA21_01930 [Candidatus Aenigmatarchaeota archaeon]
MTGDDENGLVEFTKRLNLTLIYVGRLGNLDSYTRALVEKYGGDLTLGEIYDKTRQEAH